MTNQKHTLELTETEVVFLAAGLLALESLGEEGEKKPDVMETLQIKLDQILHPPEDT